MCRRECFQAVNNGKYEYYDYGSKKANNEHYQQSSPPPYIIENIPADIPIALFWGDMGKISIDKSMFQISYWKKPVL